MKGYLAAGASVVAILGGLYGMNMLPVMASTYDRDMQQQAERDLRQDRLFLMAEISDAKIDIVNAEYELQMDPDNLKLQINLAEAETRLEVLRDELKLVTERLNGKESR